MSAYNRRPKRLTVTRVVSWTALWLSIGAHLFSSGNAAWAGGCYGYGSSYYPTYYATPYYAPSYTPVYETKVYNRITVFDFTAPYAVGYALPYVAPAVAVPATTTTTAASPAQSTCEVKTAQLEAKLAVLEAKLIAAITAGGSNGSSVGSPNPGMTPTSAPPANTPKAQSEVLVQPRSILASNRCATCHDLKVSAEKGGGLALSRDGKALPLDDKTVGAVIREVVTQHMPLRGEKLTQQEANILLDELLVMSAAAKKK